MQVKSAIGFSRRAHHLTAMFGAAAMVLAWLIPNHYPPWLSFYNEGVMAIALGLLTLSIAVMRPKAGWPPIAYCFALAVVLPWLQFAAGLLNFSGDAWIATLYLAGIAVSIAVGYQWAESDAGSLPVIVSVALLIAAFLSSSLGIVQAFHGGVLQIWGLDGLPGMRAAGNLGQPNHLATLLGFGCVSLLLIYERRLLGGVASAAILGLLLLGLALTQARTALLYGPAIATLLWFYARRQPGLIRTTPRLALVATAFHWLLVQIWPKAQLALLMVSPSFTESGVKSTRWQAWQMFLDAASAAPFFGYGWLQAGAAQFRVADSYPALGELFLSTHNFVIEMIVWLGFPLGCLISLAIAYWFVTRIFKVRSLESICGIMLLVLLGLHSMTEFPFQYAYFLIPAGLFAGHIEYVCGSPSVAKPIYGTLLVVGALTLFLSVSKDYLTLENEYRKFRFQQLKIGLSVADTNEVRAPFLSGVVAYMHAHTLASAASGDSLVMRRVAERYPYGNTLFQYALSLAREHKLEDAQRVFETIGKIHGIKAERSFRLELLEKLDQHPSYRLLHEHLSPIVPLPTNSSK